MSQTSEASNVAHRLQLRAKFIGGKYDTYEVPYDSDLDMEAAALLEEQAAQLLNMQSAINHLEAVIARTIANTVTL